MFESEVHRNKFSIKLYLKILVLYAMKSWGKSWAQKSWLVVSNTLNLQNDTAI